MSQGYKAITKNWEYFSVIESDLKTISRFVGISKNNFKAHSIAISNLLLLSCAKIETTLHDFMSNTLSIEENINNFLNKYQGINHFRSYFPLWDIHLQPFSESLQSWLLAYDNVKHDDALASESGNLENALNSISGLYILLLYCEKKFSQKKNQIYIPTNIAPELIFPHYGGVQYGAIQVGFTGGAWTNYFTVIWE